jgi:uncharacterized membrane protein YhdT
MKNMKKLIISYCFLSMIVIAALVIGTIFFANIRYPLWYSICCLIIATIGLVIITPLTVKLIKFSRDLN